MKAILNFVFLFTVLLISNCKSVKEEKSQANFMYKIGVEVHSGDYEYQDKLIALEINFNEKLKECNAYGKKVDLESIKVIEVNAAGDSITDCIAQYDLDKLLWTMEGNTPASKTRFYNILFNTTDVPSIEFLKTKLIEKVDLGSKWAFNTPSGYYVYDKKGGAFDVFAPQKCTDNEHGKDWVRGDYKEYNGILNVGDPNTKGIFHPHNDIEADDGIWKGSKSELVLEGPIHYQIRSINKFGDLPDDYRSNTTYSILFDIYANYIKATVTAGNEHGYAAIMEMTPGGDSLEITDYVIRSNGQKYSKNDTLAMDISPEWFFAGDADDSSKLFFIHAEDDSIKDGIHWYDFMQGLMIGWGRGANPGINTYPNTYYFGFSDAADYGEMKKLVASITNTPDIKVSQTEKFDLYSWGAIDFIKENGNLKLTLENSQIKCIYATVVTANPETAITSFLLKGKNIDLSGKHLGEMAKTGEIDRGVLSDKTGIIYEGKDKKIVHLEWDEGASIEEITLYKDKPYLKIDYLNMYVNICDMGNEDIFNDGKFVIYGADAWQKIRKEKLNSGFNSGTEPHGMMTEYLFPAYPNPLLGDWGISAEQNPMNYKGWYILGIYSPSNKVGYGRVVPAHVVDHVKLLSKSGFEQFPFWFGGKSKKPFSEYLFAIEGGEENIISMGKQIIEEANKEVGFNADLTNKIISNGIVEVGYGNDEIVKGNVLSGISYFNYKPTNINLAEALDAHGVDYAKYVHGGVFDYKISYTGKAYMETTISISSQDNAFPVQQKKERIFKDLPILEIEYTALDFLWWEDFYSNKNVENRVYTFQGIDKPIDADMHREYVEKAELNCGHNFGDCFLQAAGASMEQCTYKGCLIFGFYDSQTQVGLGFVIPEAIGLHDGLKLWSMHNYESFPFYNMPKQLPLKRWIFATSKGQEGILSTGKLIAEIHSTGENLSANLQPFGKN